MHGLKKLRLLEREANRRAAEKKRRREWSKAQLNAAGLEWASPDQLSHEERAFAHATPDTHLASYVMGDELWDRFHAEDEAEELVDERREAYGRLQELYTRWAFPLHNFGYRLQVATMVSMLRAGAENLDPDRVSDLERAIDHVRHDLNWR